MYNDSFRYEYWPLKNAKEARKSSYKTLLRPLCKISPANPQENSFSKLNFSLSLQKNMPNHQVDLFYLNEQVKMISPRDQVLRSTLIHPLNEMDDQD
jgi:hypothetical protein